MEKFTKKVAITMAAIMFVVMAGAGIVMAADTLSGTVAKKDERIVLEAADGSYILEGEAIGADLVGKTVNLTGTVAEKEKTKVFTVLTVKEVAE